MRTEELIVTICRVSVLALVLLTQGCVNNDSNIACAIAAFPAPELGTDKHITFQDSDGQRIEKDGQLLVLRCRSMYYAQADVTVAAEIVEIRNGRATIQDEWLLASVWMDVTWFPVVVFFVQPFVGIQLVPMIPGYHIDPRDTIAPPCFRLCPPPHTLPPSGPPPEIRRKAWSYTTKLSKTLTESAKAPSQARAGWQEVRSELETMLGRRRFGKPARWRSGRDNAERFVRMIDEDILHSSEGSPAESQPATAP